MYQVLIQDNLGRFRGFRIPATTATGLRIYSLALGFSIPQAKIFRIADSTTYKQTFLGFRNPDYLKWGEVDGVPGGDGRGVSHSISVRA